MSACLPVTVGIASKDRPELLGATIAELARTVPGIGELLILDDGSNAPLPQAGWGALPFPVRCIRHATPTGYIAARNEIARACRTDFILSCDDDSHPVHGDLAAAVAYLEARPDLIALSFPYTEGPARKVMNPSAAPEPYPVRQFIGCAHLMRVAYFRELGGYLEWLVQQNEERELCYRARANGWRVAHFPGLRFHHAYTPMGRNWNRHEYYTMRNEMAVELRYAPWLVALTKVVRNAGRAAAISWRRRGCGALAGYWAGLVARGVRGQRMGWSDFRDLQRLRWC